MDLSKLLSTLNDDAIKGILFAYPAFVTIMYKIGIYSYWGIPVKYIQVNFFVSVIATALGFALFVIVNLEMHNLFLLIIIVLVLLAVFAFVFTILYLQNKSDPAGATKYSISSLRTNSDGGIS